MLNNVHSLSPIAFGNGIRIELKDDLRHFRGIGRVSADDVLLRDPDHSAFVDIRSPDGKRLCDFTVENQTRHDDGVVLNLGCSVAEGGPMEWMLHSVQQRYNTANWDVVPRRVSGTTLELILRPAARHFGGYSCVGFSYQYRYHSDDIAIYKIIDRGTWEPGGTSVGNEIWMRGGFDRAIARIESRDQHYSSEWYLPAIANPNIFQFLPMQTELQGFTFTAGPAGTVLTIPTRLAHIRTLIEKRRESDVIAHWHEHCQDLSHDLETSPVEVLWLAGELSRHERINLYELVKETVFASLHRQAGLRRERVQTHGMIEEWGNPDLQDYARRGIPALAKAGIKTLSLANHFENNMNVYGVSNMCCTVDLKVAPSVGEENLKALCAAAGEHGISPWMWGNTALSTLALMEIRHHGREGALQRRATEDSAIAIAAGSPAGFVHNPSGAIEADHYTPVFAQMNLCDSTIRQMWLSRWRRAHDKIGLNGIFLDSSFNLSSDKFDWQANTHVGREGGATLDQSGLQGFCRPEQEPPSAIRSQYLAHLGIVREMQAFGMTYCGEDNGVFGVHRAGPEAARKTSSLFMWTDTLNNFDVPGIRAVGADPDDVFFRALAYRMMWMVHWDPASGKLSWNQGGWRNEDDSPTERQISLIKTYNDVDFYMNNRTVLPDERGVVYRHQGKTVLWAFEDMQIVMNAETFICQNMQDRIKQTVNGSFAAKAHQVYLLNTIADIIDCETRPMQLTENGQKTNAAA